MTALEEMAERTINRWRAEKATRSGRLRMGEHQIQFALEQRYRVGHKLKEIRDDRLYEEDGFETFEKYCRARFDLSGTEAAKLITLSECREILPNKGFADWTGPA